MADRIGLALAFQRALDEAADFVFAVSILVWTAHGCSPDVGSKSIIAQLRVDLGLSFYSFGLRLDGDGVTDFQASGRNYPCADPAAAVGCEGVEQPLAALFHETAGFCLAFDFEFYAPYFQ